jgi:hypothetical protein
LQGESARGVQPRQGDRGKPLDLGPADYQDVSRWLSWLTFLAIALALTRLGARLVGVQRLVDLTQAHATLSARTARIRSARRASCRCAWLLPSAWPPSLAARVEPQEQATGACNATKE